MKPQLHREHLLLGGVVALMVLAVPYAARAQTSTCNRTISANVVALDQVFFWNRLGAVQPPPDELGGVQQQQREERQRGRAALLVLDHLRDGVLTGQPGWDPKRLAGGDDGRPYRPGHAHHGLALPRGADSPDRDHAFW